MRVPIRQYFELWPVWRCFAGKAIGLMPLAADMSLKGNEVRLGVYEYPKCIRVSTTGRKCKNMR